ncbi:MAG: LPS assembly protein LptD [Desulfovibrionaceae bacterium]|nr:LPS assembly protein LptD [Desulfovibrionaceae bacterium]
MRIRYLLSIFIYCISFILLHKGLSYAQEQKTNSSQNSISHITQNVSKADKTDWKITAENLSSSVQSTVVEASGNVVITNGAITLKADYIRYFTDTQWVYLRGNVLLHFEDNAVIKADEAEINTENLKGFMMNASIQLEDPFVLITGKEVERKGDKSYFFRNATVTSCDAEVPPWEFSARLIDVYIDGYTVLYDSTVNIYGMRTITIPSLLIPSNVSRQTGFLMPSLAFSNNKGASLEIPFYWAIDEHNDLLFTANVMSKKGVMLGSRYRARYKEYQKIWLAGNWIYETNLDNLRSPVTKDTYTPSNNRYWIRGMADTSIGYSRWNFQMNVDYASDLSFMSDYKNGMLGSNATLNETFDFFGRELNPIRQNRISEAVISRSYNRFGLAFSARYEEDLLSMQNAITATDGMAVQELPSAELFVYRQGIFGDLPITKYLPFEFETNLQTTYFMRNSSNHGFRAVFNPTIYLPMQWDYISITPLVKLNQRAYFNTTTKNPNGSLSPKQNQHYVMIPEYTIQAESTLSRPYKIHTDTPLSTNKPTKWSGIMHTIQPFLSYTYRHNVDQSRLPEYTLLDRLEAINAIRYGFTTSLVRKREHLITTFDEESGALSTHTDYDYLRFLSLTIEQSFLPSREGTQYKYNLLPVELTLKYYITSTFSLRTFTKIDSIYGDLIRTDVTAEYLIKDFRLALGYDFQEKRIEYYQPEKINSIYVEIETPVFYSLQINGRYAHDIKRDKPSEIIAELRYVNQCYSIGLRYYQDFFDAGIGLLFSIPTLL